MLYTYTKVAEQNERKAFYDTLPRTLSNVNKEAVILLISNSNAGVRICPGNFENKMEIHGVGNLNENGELLLEICGNFELCEGSTIFAHTICHKTTWLSPKGMVESHIVLCISQKR